VPRNQQMIIARVELDATQRPVAGRLVVADGRQQPFAGWTELFAALQHAVAAAVGESAS
jgi:hypothetical protein